MLQELAYVETLRSLVNSLRSATKIETWRIYAVIRALVHAVQDDLSIIDCVKAHAQSVFLSEFLSECRLVAFHTSDGSITRAMDYLAKLETVA